MNETPPQSDTVISLVQRLCLGLVQYNQHLEIAVTGDQSQTIEIRVNRADYPRVIGKKAAHFRAIQAIAEESGTRAGRTVRVGDIREPIHGREELMGRFKPRNDWPRAEVLQLVKDTTTAVFGAGCGVLMQTDQNMPNTRIAVSVPGNTDVWLVEEMAGHYENLFGSIAKTNGGILNIQFQR